MDITEPSAENVFSAAALKIIRRHRPGADDPRYCRACGRPVGDCDVVALADVFAGDVRATPHRPVRTAAPARAGRAAGPRPPRVRVPKPAVAAASAATA